MATEDGITLTPVQEKMAEISEGNPGALTVLIQLAQGLPPKFLEAVVDYLAENGPKGSGLWMLYKDSNGEDIELLALTLIGRMNEKGIDTQALALSALADMGLDTAALDAIEV